MELQDWAILKQLKSFFLKSVKVALVFGKSGSEALLLTRDGKVYGIGTNRAGHLGLGDECPRAKLTEISALSSKGVEGFAYGGNASTSEKHFVIAYLNNNELYYWGLIPCNETPLLTPTLIHKFDYKVEEVACGNSHCVVLCEDGKTGVYLGHQRKGQLGRTVDELMVSEGEVKEESSDNENAAPKIYPVGRVRGIIDEEVVIQISCGAQFTVAVINDGRVVSWGCNEKSQLGFATVNSFTSVPTEITSVKNMIRKVSCGREFVIASRVNSGIMFWGNNEPFKFSMSRSNQLPPDTYTNIRSKVREVAASYLFNFFIVVEDSGSKYCFGLVNNAAASIKSPCRSTYQAFNQVVSAMATPMRVKYRRALNDVLIHSFENQKYCDFVIEAEGKEFHVHKAVIMMRSPYFDTILSRWLDSKTNIYSIEGKSVLVIEAYLKFIYTDSLDVDLEVAVESLQLADEYCDDDFKVMCEEVIIEKMTLSNVVDVYPLTSKMENVEKLNARCIELSAAQPNHLENMVKSDGYKHWDLELCRSLCRCMQKEDV